jgi:hypothetical protein
MTSDNPKKLVEKESTNNSAAVLRQGIILPIEHPSNPNLYYVHFGEKTTNPDGRLDGGIWCHNALNSFTRYRDIENNPISYGSWTPIMPYTPVNVLMSNGGAGSGHIIGFAPTNTNTPDPENRDGLHIIAQSPKGSLIAIDDKTGNLQFIYNKGSSGLILGENMISMEVMKGGTGDKEGDTSISLSKGSIKLKLRDSTLQFDESGLNVSFDDGGSYVKITKGGVEIHGENHVKFTSKEEVSMKGSKMTLQGTKDASINANHLKLGGKQLTSVTGSQIHIESMFSTQLSSALHVGIRAGSMLYQETQAYTLKASGASTVETPIMAFKNATHTIKTGTFAVGAGSVFMDGNVVSNSGLGDANASVTFSSTSSSIEATHTALGAMCTNLLTKQAGISGTNKILADTLAGTSEPAQDPSGNAGGAKDKNDKKTYGSVVSSKYVKKNTVMEKFSTVPNLVYRSKTNLLMAKTYFGDVPLNPAGLNQIEDELQEYTEYEREADNWRSGENDLNDGLIGEYTFESAAKKQAINLKPTNIKKRRAKPIKNSILFKK